MLRQSFSHLAKQLAPLSRVYSSAVAVYVPKLPREDTPFPKDFKEHPDRDLVNFPHPERKLYSPPVRLGFIPDTWFQFFYNKTGVTGPYFFGGGLVVFLLQKELWVFEHESVLLLPLLTMFYGASKYLGPKLAASLDKHNDEQEKLIFDFKDIQVNGAKEAIANEQKHQAMYGYVIDKLHEAKKENVALQLETTYRQRLSQVYSEVKRRLDYVVELEEAKKRFQQRYMVDWIVDQVRKSITAQQEKAALQQCIADLKVLSARV